MWQTLKNLYHWATAWVYHAIHSFPARRLKLIGITGTDGKTTTSSLIYHILRESGRKVSVITTVSAVIGGVSQDTGFHVTTPDPHMIPRYMAQAVAHGDEYMVFEITSHALHQHRAAPVRFAISGITNITHEHLDYHRTLGSYIAAKAKLISLSARTYVNGDQPDIASHLLRRATPGHEVVTYGLTPDSARHRDIAMDFGLDLEPYNKYNYLLAYLICRDLGITDEQYGQAVRTFRLPAGRMETIYEGAYTVIIDFAHTPHAIAQALHALALKYPGRRIIHVFGSAGRRDASKRPQMGASSGRYASRIILTEEDYRDEDPSMIATAIASGLDASWQRVSPEQMRQADESASHLYTYIESRADAVALAVAIARPGDVIVATGKAHETTLCRGTTEHEYSEREAFAAVLGLT